MPFAVAVNATQGNCFRKPGSGDIISSLRKLLRSKLTTPIYIPSFLPGHDPKILVLGLFDDRRD
jgi:hypothetical protein